MDVAAATTDAAAVANAASVSAAADVSAAAAVTTDAAVATTQKINSNRNKFSQVVFHTSLPASELSFKLMTNC